MFLVISFFKNRKYFRSIPLIYIYIYIYIYMYIYIYIYIYIYMHLDIPDGTNTEAVIILVKLSHFQSYLNLTRFNVSLPIFNSEITCHYIILLFHENNIISSFPPFFCLFFLSFFLSFLCICFHILSQNTVFIFAK